MRFSLLSAFILFMASLSSAQANEAKVADSLAGQWRVTAVHLDERATSSVGTSVDDPRYVGRILGFNNETVRGDLDDAMNCVHPSYQQQLPMSLNALIEKTSAARNVAPTEPVAEDFGLKYSGAEKLTPVVIACQQGRVGPAGESIKNWVAALSADSLLMNWFDNSYLVLQRVNPGEKLSPSFSCEAKLNTVEKTICGDNSLAAWDRSVASAWKIRLWQQQQTDPQDSATLEHITSEQRNWIVKRNQCQADTACIKNAMQQRVGALSEEFQ